MMNKKTEKKRISSCDICMNYTYDEDVMAVINNDDSTMAALLAHDVREELEKLPKNPWLSVYIKLMDDYII